MVAILDLKVKTWSNHQIDIKYENLDQKKAKNDIMYSIVGQTVEKWIFKMAGGGHFVFGPLTELAHPFWTGMGAKCFI